MMEFPIIIIIIIIIVVVVIYLFFNYFSNAEFFNLINWQLFSSNYFFIFYKFLRQKRLLHRTFKVYAYVYVCDNACMNTTLHLF